MKFWKLLIYCAIVLTLALFPIQGFAKSDTLVYGTTEKVTDMDPAHAYDFHTWEIFYNIYQGLLTYPAGKTDLAPGLAENYFISVDGKEYTFELRKGLKFSDGTPFDASAVKWSVDRVIALKGDPSWLVTEFVDRVDVVDKYTVKFVLKNPVAYFPSLVASVPYYPVNPNIYPVDKIIRDPSEMKGGKLVGLGPYVVRSFKRDQEIILEANPNYFGPRPKTKRIVIRYFADATTMRLALEKGEIDLAFKTLNPSDISDLEKSNKINTIKAQGPYIRYLCFRCVGPPFDDKILRQAVAAAINRPPLIQKVYLGQNAPLYSMVPMGMWSHTDAFKTVHGDGNIAKVKKLLASKGYNEGNKLAFDLWYTPSHYGDTEVDLAAVLKNQLEATGVMKVSIKSAEWATYKDNWKNKLMSAFLLGWYPDYIDPDNYTAAFGQTAGSRGMGIFFSDPVWDKKLTEGQTLADMQKRTAIYKEVQQMWTVDVPTVPIYQGILYVFTQKSVGGVLLSPTLRFNYDPIYKD
ncbi:MAG: peptide ABC transporter substrate-binding protein [Deltaproteobacteria bacterium]|nr:peptide ABC transporter substrate-binding protein [Deltaproteobacteria bacterium]MBW2052842.1 peptide ABC transporter substrate-binding protein [Deltaproteobacteria bacterium]MBW2142158.1 peptide ABC transporter substrate-binding protein [Deltaproteobacteria bacterium]MBW2323024.1 peptide ABC transporter substrate-binding protein [Deltaproteobacteria bacterium]